MILYINLNMIFYTHVEHSPTEAIYIKYYTEEVHWVRAQELCESRDGCPESLSAVSVDVKQHLKKKYLGCY